MKTPELSHFRTSQSFSSFDVGGSMLNVRSSLSLLSLLSLMSFIFKFHFDKTPRRKRSGSIAEP
jgi:hypothetical protein